MCRRGRKRRLELELECWRPLQSGMGTEFTRTAPVSSAIHGRYNIKISHAWRCFHWSSPSRNSFRNRMASATARVSARE